MPSFCRLELPWRIYHPIRTLKVFNEILSFILGFLHCAIMSGFRKLSHTNLLELFFSPGQSAQHWLKLSCPQYSF